MKLWVMPPCPPPPLTHKTPECVLKEVFTIQTPVLSILKHIAKDHSHVFLKTVISLIKSE